jgi:hypothetical protein
MPLPDGGGLYSVSLRLQSGEVHSVSVYSNAGAQLDEYVPHILALISVLYRRLKADHLKVGRYQYHLYQPQAAPSISTWTTRNTASESSHTRTKIVSMYPTQSA